MTTATRWLRPEPFRNPWRAVAVALLPLMILGLLISALWNPQERLDTVKAAIVNLDEPVKVEGQTVPLGRQLAAGLVSGGESADVAAGQAAAVPASDASYDWEVSDASSAADGLADGTYSAVITIPEGFSAAATSFSGDDPAKARQATIDVATGPEGRVLDDALAQVVAQTATGVLSSTLTETYVDNVLVGFSTLSKELGKAADGADQLASGATDAGKGAKELADGAHQTSDGVAGVGEGASGLAGGAGELSAGAKEWAAGADQAAGGVSQLADGAGQSAAGASDLASGADELATGTEGVAKGAKGLAGGLAETAAKTEQLPEGGRALADGVQELVDGIKQSCKLGTINPGFAAMCADQEKLDQLTTGMNDFAGNPGAKPSGLYELSAGISGLSQGANELSAGTDQVAGGASGLADGAHQLSGGLAELHTGADQAAAGVTELSTAARGISDGAGGLASGANELSAGVGELETGTNQLATGVDGLADGVGELAGGATDLSDGLGQATEEIPSYTEQERKSLASVVADPVATDGEVTDLDTGAVGPMFAVLALWLGALALMIVFSPVPLHSRGSTRGALRLTLGSFVIPAVVGLVTGLAAGAVLAGLEDLDVGGWFATMGFGALISVAFVAVNQALAAVLGHVGRGVSLLIAVLVIATGVVSTVPSVLEGLAGFLPVGPSLVGLVRLIEPGTGGVGMAVAAMVLWCVAGLTVTTLVVARQRTVRVAELLRTA